MHMAGPRALANGYGDLKGVGERLVHVLHVVLRTARSRFDGKNIITFGALDERVFDDLEMGLG